MTKRPSSRPKAATSRPPPPAEQRAPGAASTNTKSVVERNTEALATDVVAVLAGRHAVKLREDTVDLREEAADLREEAATVRERALRPKEQAARVQAALSALTEAELREANEHLVVATLNAHTKTDESSYRAGHDFLTGLPNRSLLTDRVAQSITLARRHCKKVALLYLDLDHFKQINDTLGHAVGDHVLQSIATRLQQCVRESDTVSRYGGDEFVVLLSEVEDAHGAILTAEKLLEAVTRPHFVAGQWLHVTLSIGISLHPDHGDDIEAVLRNADTAMYHAKKSGRSNYQVFTPDMRLTDTDSEAATLPMQAAPR